MLLDTTSELQAGKSPRSASAWIHPGSFRGILASKARILEETSLSDGGRTLFHYERRHATDP